MIAQRGETVGGGCAEMPARPWEECPNRMTNQRRLGRYRLDEPLGRGSMGEGWRAHDEVLGRTVAIKLLPEQVFHVGSVEGERLLREAHAAAWIEHPNVVALYDIDRAEGRPFLGMEALNG